MFRLGGQRRHGDPCGPRCLGVVLHGFEKQCAGPRDCPVVLKHDGIDQCELASLADNGSRHLHGAESDRMKKVDRQATRPHVGELHGVFYRPTEQSAHVIAGQRRAPRASGECRRYEGFSVTDEETVLLRRVWNRSPVRSECSQRLPLCQIRVAAACRASVLRLSATSGLIARRRSQPRPS